MSIWKWIRKIKNGNLNNSNNINQTINPISARLEKTLNEIQSDLGNSPDIVIRRFFLGKQNLIPAALIYTDGMVNSSDINNFLRMLFIGFPTEHLHQPPIKIIKEQLLNIGDVKELQDKTQIINEILRGSTAIFIDNSKTALIAATKGWESRNITDPENQVVLRGSRESFTEKIRTNTSMIRRIVSSSKLRIEQMKIGKLTETTVEILYIDGIANEKIVEEVRRRLRKIDTDSILGAGYIEEFIQDNQWSLFPTVAYAERPDIASAQLLEGKVLILVDGTPFILILPVNFVMFFQSADDYYIRSIISSFTRLLRIITFMIAMLLPGLYVAITTFHPELIPTTLLVSLAAQREGVPFPAFIEAVIMELTFEVLREAGVRMPRPIGQAVSIVGALVLGTAAVEAGIVSPGMVIIVSMTAIASFTAPYIDLAITARIIRFIMLVFGASFGLFGILFGLMVMGIHLTTIRSFGVPYLIGVAPFNLTDQKDIFVRFPWILMKSRPRIIGKQDTRRQDDYIPYRPKPRPRQRRDE